MLLRSTDLTESWFILDTYEGEVAKIDYAANEIHVKNYKVVSTRAEAAKDGWVSPELADAVSDDSEKPTGKALKPNMADFKHPDWVIENEKDEEFRILTHLE